MKLLLMFSLIFLVSNCNKPKSVLICGDHVCINKAEAEQFFEENLTIEVKIIDIKDKKTSDLIELNLKNDVQGKRQITLSTKEDKIKNLKTLSNKEVLKIKEKIKKKEQQKIAKKSIKKMNKKSPKKIINKTNVRNDISGTIKKTNKANSKVVDICTILEKCSIDEISKYLINVGKKRGFPDITRRQ